MGLNFKHLFAVLAGAMLLAVLSAGAFAQTVINLDASPEGTKVATEYTGTTIGAAGNLNGLGVWHNFATSASSTGFNNYYMRYNLNGGGATFNGTPSVTVLTNTDGAKVGSPTLGGGGSSYVIFQLSVTGGSSITGSNTVTFKPSGINYTSESTVSLSYALYIDVTQAQGQTSALYGPVTGNYLRFVEALVEAATPPATQNYIDVANDNKLFSTAATGGQTTDKALFGDMYITVNSDTIANGANTPVAIGDMVAATSLLTVTGDFAATFTTAGAPDTNNVWIDDTDDCYTKNIPSAAYSPVTVTSTYAVWNIGQNTIPTSYFFCMQVNKSTAITPGTYTAVYSPKTTGNNWSFSTVTLGTIGTLQLNGSSAYANLLLAPGGAYKAWLRVTNTSNLGGAVSFQCWNDDGASATFPLNGISGQTSGALNAYSSTSLITMEDIYDAANVASGGSFSLASASKNKMRCKVSGNFPTIDIQVLSASQSLDVFTMITPPQPTE